MDHPSVRKVAFLRELCVDSTPRRNACGAEKLGHLSPNYSSNFEFQLRELCHGQNCGSALMSERIGTGALRSLIPAVPSAPRMTTMDTSTPEYGPLRDSVLTCLTAQDLLGVTDHGAPADEDFSRRIVEGEPARPTSSPPSAIIGSAAL
jgi:hypothetical protein